MSNYPDDIIPMSPTCAHPDWSVDGDLNVGPGYGAGAAPAELVPESVEETLEETVPEPVEVPAEGSGKRRKDES